VTSVRGARAGTRDTRLWHDIPMDVAHVIQSALAPVFLISGVGVMLGVLTNRLARIVDRARVWENEAEREAQRSADLEAVSYTHLDVYKRQTW